MDIITGAIISGIIYDILKNGTLITAKNIKDYFSEELLEISNEQAREIAEQAKSLDFDNPNEVSKDEFIEKHRNFFNVENSLNSTATQNIKNNYNSGIQNTNSAQVINQNFGLPPAIDKKKD
ncbi:hypothetical protein ACTXJ5_13210 [Psychrobacter alimentarius]|uniref:hypothetical protein n=1 Tax=Psychrobacter alimentarius TaxID=261164 RepID=UPI003FD35F19